MELFDYNGVLQAKVNALRDSLSQTQEELDALLLSHKGMISVLDIAFKGKL